MRILYFTRDYTTHDRRFLKRMAQARHDVYFLRLEDDGIEYERRPLPDKIVPISWQGGKGPVKTPGEWLRLMPEFSKILEEVRPDLVHAGPVQSCAFMTALAGFRPLLVMSWGSDMLVDAGKDEFWQWMTKYTLERADFVFCDCQAVREAVCRTVSFADEALLQDCWGVDLSQFSPGADRLRLKEKPGWEGSVVVLTTRTWEPIYGPDIALEAFRKAYGKDGRLRLVMLGNGSMKKDIEKRIRLAGLDAVIDCPGHVRHDQLPDFFRASDLYLSCSYSDGSSISLMEAMATGLPVIVTNSPGNREWVRSGENGWLAPAGAPERFGTLLTKAAALRPEQRCAIGRLNRKTVERHADGDVTFSRLLELYDRIEQQWAKDIKPARKKGKRR